MFLHHDHKACFFLEKISAMAISIENNEMLHVNNDQTISIDWQTLYGLKIKHFEGELGWSL